MLADREKILRRLVIWLKAQDFGPVVEDGIVTVRLQGKIGEWRCRIIVEDPCPRLGNPPRVTLISRMPIRIPESRIADTAAMLHSLTRQIGIGCLSMSGDERTIFYRLTLTLDRRTTCEKTFAYALRQSVFYMEEHVGFLCFFCFNSEFNRRRAAYHLETSGLGPSKLTYPGNYDEFHSDGVMGTERAGDLEE
jgi:hypothetical protein